MHSNFCIISIRLSHLANPHLVTWSGYTSIYPHRRTRVFGDVTPLPSIHCFTPNIKALHSSKRRYFPVDKAHRPTTPDSSSAPLSDTQTSLIYITLKGLNYEPSINFSVVSKQPRPDWANTLVQGC